MSSHWKAILGVILIFLLGFASGMVSSGIFAERQLAKFLKRPGVALMDAMEHKLTKNLALDSDQKKQIHAYFMANLKQHKQLQNQIMPQVQDLNHATVQQIRAELRPDQQKVFDQNLADLQNRYWNYASNQDISTTADSDGQGETVGAGTNSAPGAPPAPQ